MKRRELFRRSVLGTLGAAFTALASGKPALPNPEAREFPSGHDASKELARSDWKPTFLDEHQNRTLTELADHIIPDTDTPGAKAAQVNRFIDHLLAAESREVQTQFLDSLAYLDGGCMGRYGSAFIHLARENQVEFLNLIAYPHRLVNWGDNRSEFPGHTQFNNLKDWISRAYYNSEVGMKDLGWSGTSFHGTFSGCEHPKGTHR